MRRLGNKHLLAGWQPWPGCRQIRGRGNRRGWVGWGAVVQCGRARLMIACACGFWWLAALSMMSKRGSGPGGGGGGGYGQKRFSGMTCASLRALCALPQSRAAIPVVRARSVWWRPGFETRRALSGWCGGLAQGAKCKASARSRRARCRSRSPCLACAGRTGGWTRPSPWCPRAAAGGGAPRKSLSAVAASPRRRRSPRLRSQRPRPSRKPRSHGGKRMQ